MGVRYKIKFPIRCVDTGEVFYRYREYLFSRHWMRIRSIQLANKPYCFCCHEWATEVHHNCYQNIGSEHPRDLVSLCRHCHETIHELLDSDPERALGMVHGSLEEINSKERKQLRLSDPLKPVQIRISGAAFDFKELQKALYAPIKDLR